MADPEALTIQDVAARTGVSVATLRAWEQRHGFPAPRRDARGHRRYGPDDCARIARVAADRDAGMSLAAAIARSASAEVEPAISIQAEVRRLAPALAPHAHDLRTLVALSQAVEDECSTSADRPVLVGAFQTAAAYREVEDRWRHLAGAASAALVLARFTRRRRTAPGPVEVPFAVDARIRDEWAVLVHSPSLTVGLVAWERPGPRASGARRADRVYEAVWTVDRAIVARAVEVALAVGRVTAADERAVRDALARPPAADRDAAQDAVRVANRMVAYVAGSRSLGSAV